MPIAYCFMDDEGFLWEYLGSNTYSSEGVLSIGDPNNPTTNVAINATSVSVGNPSSNVTINSTAVVSSNVISNGISCNTLTLVHQVFSTMPANCASDASAASAGIPLGGIYMNAGILMVRQT